MTSTAAAPTLEGWGELYRQGRSFQETAPWRLFTDAHVFAIEEPETGDVAYCTVMGAGGMEYGLLAWRGATGLHTYALMANQALDEDEVLLEQDCLSFSLGDREQVLPHDREVHKALGLRFRGRGAWPLFRSHRPGYLPASPSAQEARFLATCLEQSCALFGEIVSGRHLPEFPEGDFPARRQNAQGLWETCSLPFRPPVAAPTLDVDAHRVQAVKRQFLRLAQTWQAAVQLVAPITEDTRDPFWAWFLLTVDAQSGFILGADMGGPDDGVQGQLLKAIERARGCPREVQVTSVLLESRLRPLVEALGIRIRRVKRLREVERASSAFKARFEGG